MRGGKRITAEKEEQIIAALEVTSHASRVAAELGVSFSTVWRRADREGIPLADGQKAKGYKRLSTERREKIIEIRRAKPEATQEVVAREAGVSRATVSRVTRAHRRRVKISPIV